VNPGPPAAAELGERLKIVGVVDSVIVKTRLFDTNPPGFRTVIAAEPGAPIRLAGT